MDYVYSGYCGVYCGACPMMLDTKIDRFGKDEQCYGCKSEKPTGFCATCGIKACAQKMGFEFCYQCDELKSCDLMSRFVSDEQYPYGKCVFKNMERIRDEGLPKWLEDQEKRWTCPDCGTTRSWYHRTCPRCGHAVANYQSDL